MDKSPGEVTLLLAEVKLGNKDALAKLIPLVYKELRRLAGHYMRDERTGHTLQPTALVHEAYLRLAGQNPADWQNRAQFLGVAAQLRSNLNKYLLLMKPSRCLESWTPSRLGWWRCGTSAA